MAEKHKILGDKVHIYKRSGSPVWQCSTFIAGRNRRVSTKEKSLALAKQFAEDWYLGLRGKVRDGELRSERTFKEVGAIFEKEYQAATLGERNEHYVKNHMSRLPNHLIPYFGKMGISEITAGSVQEYKVFRLTADENFKAPSRSTMHHEIVTLRQVLKLAMRHGWINGLPDFSEPYRKSNKVVHRAWFSPEDYKKLYTATRENVKAAESKSWHWDAEQLHDFVLFMANTGIRPDEANNLEFRDVLIADDEWSDDTILEIEVRGKRGVGFCKSTPGAVIPFKRLQARERKDADGQLNKPKPTDKVFPAYHKKQFNRILTEQDLKVDRDGQRRTAYSLRHTYISLRLLEGADIYQIAKNCRTSVEMIEKHYAAHIKDRIDTRAINVRRKK